jgi:hypothetical protein
MKFPGYVPALSKLNKSKSRAQAVSVAYICSVARRQIKIVFCLAVKLSYQVTRLAFSSSKAAIDAVAAKVHFVREL